MKTREGGGVMNYPNGSKPKPVNKPVIQTKKAVKAHLGIDFEDMINQSNTYYLQNDLCLSYKKPTPIRITKVDYPSRNRARITEAFYQVPSTTDYNGIYKGKYVDFEAKSCNGKSFSFSHIYEHQIAHLDKVRKHGGISFLIILFNDYKEVFLLDALHLVELYEDAKKGGRKSIPYSYFVEHGTKISLGINPVVDYLKAIDVVFFRN